MGTIQGDLGGLPVGDSGRVLIMGVINLTKNSFYGGSVRTGSDEVSRAATLMQQQGADIIDVGARSTAPYRTSEISERTESRLLMEAIRAVSKTIELPISVDTTRYEPAKTAFAEGATILNDVYGFTQKDAPKLAKLAASRNCSVILSAHESRTRRIHDPILRISNCLESSLKMAADHGIESAHTTIDPGIGFFSDSELSNVEWNCNTIARLSELRKFGRPICVGVSRKRFIGMLTGEKSADLRLSGSLAATAISVYNGAHVIRTHDVKETNEAVKIAEAVRKNSLIHRHAGSRRELNGEERSSE
ncbi:MAG: dihydropteroate synthase [Nitrososphaerota archaeon]|nr:dihydropteroate synthase [Nitrososphaerota archaeon]